jgi:cell division inhibitor SepF
VSTTRSLQEAVDHFGSDDDEFDDYDDEARAAREERARRREERHEARRFGAHDADPDDVLRADESSVYRRSSPEHSARSLALVRPDLVEFGHVTPQSFDEAQQIADRFRADSPVIVDLRGCEVELVSRVTDFCSGLTYALDGSVQLVGERILLLAPSRFDLTSQATAGFLEKGFFNQE